MPPVLISDFTGADENPLSEGGNWAVTAAANPLQRVGNAVTGISTNPSMSHWVPDSFGPDLEAYVTLVVTSATFVGIAARIKEEGTNTYDGYIILANTTSNNCGVYRVDNAVATPLVTVSVTWGNGDKLGIRCQGSAIEAWRQISGNSDWILLATANDGAYPLAGRVALRCNNATARLDDFYVGPMEYFFGGVPIQVPAVYPPAKFGPF